MNRWYQIRRLRGAIILILIGVLFLLDQWHIMRFGVSWPLILIVLGVMKLAERTAWTADLQDQQAAQGAAPGATIPPSPPYGGSPWTGAQPFIQPHPPTPEDSGKFENGPEDRQDRPEDFNREGR